MPKIPAGVLTEPSATSPQERPLYQCIVADPPWPMAAKWGTGAATGRFMDYPMMPIDWIRELPVKATLAAPTSHLYLWTLFQTLPSALEIAKAWGYKPVQMLTWAKTGRGGLGGAFRSNTEQVLFCRRGTLRELSTVGSTWFNWPRTGRHSVKPDEFFGMVEEVSPGPRIELFSRQARPGWDSWGDQVMEEIENKTRREMEERKAARHQA